MISEGLVVAVRWLKKSVALLGAFGLGIAAALAFHVLAPDFDVLTPNAAQASISMTFVSYSSGAQADRNCSAVSWTLSPDTGDPVSGEAPSTAVDNNLSPPCITGSTRLVAKGKVWVVKTANHGICDSIGVVNTDVSVTMRQYGACVVSQQNTALANQLRAAGSAISAITPAIIAVVGLIVALVFLRWSLSLLIRPFVWAGRHAIRLRVTTRDANGVISTQPAPSGWGAVRLVLVLLITAAMVPYPFRSALALLMSIIFFIGYSFPLAVIGMVTDLPEACTTSNVQTENLGHKCAAPILRFARELWSGPYAEVRATPAGPTLPHPDYLAFPHPTSVADILRSVQDVFSSALISAAIIAGSVLALLWLAPMVTPQLRRAAALFPRVGGIRFPSARVYITISFVLSLLFAIYLSVVAIVAIPIFNNDRTDRIADGRKYLAEELPKLSQQYLPSETPDFETKDLPDVNALQKNGNDALGKAQEQQNYNAASANKESLQVVLTRAGNLVYAQVWFQAQVASIRSKIVSVEELANRLRVAYKAMPEDAAQVASQVQEFFLTENTGHINGALTMRHATSLVASYGYWLADYRVQIAKCAEEFERRKSEVRKEGPDTLRELAQIIASQTWMQPHDAGAEERSECSQIKPSGEYSDRRERIDKSLGKVFGNATGWLLLTEKRDLALIVGLVGFGLFGALASSFIRRAQSDQPLTDPALLLPPLIRGVAAAIVIYLAVLGGITAFTNSDATPSPYAIFFTCFVAAVFSEDVWDWAHGKQTAQLGSDGKRDTHAQPETSETKEAANPSSKQVTTNQRGP